MESTTGASARSAIPIPARAPYSFLMHTRSVVLLAAATLAGCASPKATDIAHTTFAPALHVDLSTMTQTATGLYYKDLTVGTGAPVAAGQRVAIHYVGNLPNGTQFDANTARDTPLAFQLGAEAVVAGFDQGVTGMRVGGSRQIIIPPALGYGAQPNGPIPANAILVFTISLVSAS